MGRQTKEAARETYFSRRAGEEAKLILEVCEYALECAPRRVAAWAVGTAAQMNWARLHPDEAEVNALTSEWLTDPCAKPNFNQRQQKS
jgi:hypothetical protein